MIYKSARFEGKGRNIREIWCFIVNNSVIDYKCVTVDCYITSGNVDISTLATFYNGAKSC